MDHHDHVNLLRPAALPPGGTWADFGAGSGAFTLALRELVGPEAQIYAIDKDRASLRQLQQSYTARFGDASHLHILPADFSRPLDPTGVLRDLPPLEGALMANSLHFFKDADQRPLPFPPPNERTGARRATLRYAHLGEVPGGRRGPDKAAVLEHIRSYLKPRGTLLLVEYNVDSGNMWVPYPLSFETWRALAQEAGFSEPRLLAAHPSHFLREIYSAVCYKNEKQEST